MATSGPLRAVIVAFDTNVLAYYADLDRHRGDERKIYLTQDLLPLLWPKARLVVPVQVIGELYNLFRRCKLIEADARARPELACAGMSHIPTTNEIFEEALNLAVGHHLQMWDAIILSAAVSAGADWLLSEDMHDGFIWRERLFSTHMNVAHGRSC